MILVAASFLIIAVIAGVMSLGGVALAHVVFYLALAAMLATVLCDLSKSNPQADPKNLDLNRHARDPA